MANWLVKSIFYGIDLKNYLTHFNIDNNKTIGYPEIVLFNYNNQHPDNIEVINSVNGINTIICESLLKFLSEKNNLYWDKRTGFFIESNNINNKYFSDYQTKEIQKKFLVPHQENIDEYLLNSNPINNTLTKLQYINKEILEQIQQVLLSSEKLPKGPLHRILPLFKERVDSSNLNKTLNKVKLQSFNFDNNNNNNSLLGGQQMIQIQGQDFAHYLIPDPRTLPKNNSNLL